MRGPLEEEAEGRKFFGMAGSDLDAPSCERCRRKGKFFARLAKRSLKKLFGEPNQRVVLDPIYLCAAFKEAQASKRIKSGAASECAHLYIGGAGELV